MITLFDQEKVWEIERYNIAKQNREEGFIEGYREGYREGCLEARRDLLWRILAHTDIQEAARLTGISRAEIEKLLKESSILGIGPVVPTP